uniref:Uncharacterized protein n=1 Tax=Caenorhabditis japonica TaxID=281687 RepID=A0A8R1E3A9_CAEJA
MSELSEELAADSEESLLEGTEDDTTNPVKPSHSDASLSKFPTLRETHNKNWVRTEGKRIVEQYFNCEPFNNAQNEILSKFLSNENVENAIKSPIIEEGEDQERLDDWKYVDQVYENAIPKISYTEERIGHFFPVMASMNISNAILFPIVMMRYGGFAFLFPFIFTTVTVTVPINYILYCLGQFSSLPTPVLYTRLAPFAFPIGIALYVIQFIVSACIRFDHRFITLAIEFFYVLISEKPPHGELSRVEGVLNGFQQVCARGDVFVEGTCRDARLYRIDGKTQEEYVLAHLRSTLQQDDAILAFANGVRHPNRIYEPVYEHAHYTSAVCAMTIFLFLISFSGIKFFVVRVQRVVFVGIITACIINIFMVVGFLGSHALAFVDVIGYDVNEILRVKTWLVAAIHSLTIFGVSDGAFVFIGSINNFHNNATVDLIRCTIISLFVLILFSMFFGSAAVTGISLFFTRISKRTLTSTELRSLIFNHRHFYEYLYVFFSQTIGLRFWLLVFVICIVFWQLSGLMIMADGTVRMFYRIFKTSVRLPQVPIRLVFLMFHCVAMAFTHLSFYTYQRFPLRLGPYAAFLHLFVWNLMDFRQWYVVVMTIGRRYRGILYIVRVFALYYCKVFLQLFIGTLIAYDMSYISSSIMKRFLLVPVFFSFGIIAQYMIQRRGNLSLTPNEWFRPTFNQHYDEYRKQENALMGESDRFKGDAMQMMLNTIQQKWYKITMNKKKYKSR